MRNKENKELDKIPVKWDVVKNQSLVAQLNEIDNILKLLANTD